MKISGIICEYNPLHLGHEYLIKEAKKTADAVICVMSGHFTQRGEAAVFDKFARAESAVLSGADLVLELPFPFSASSAPYFAEAGVGLLSTVGVNTLVFGSESGELSRLLKIAEYSLTEEFQKEKARAEACEGSASAHFRALSRNGDAMRLLPNDILAMEYLRAIKKGNFQIAPEPIVRKGDGYASETLGGSAYASATAIRSALFGGELSAPEAYMPCGSYAKLRDAVASEEAPAALKNAERAILGFFRLTPPEALATIAGLGNGLEHRLCHAAKEAKTLEELMGLVATKRYTDATIRRAILAALLGVTWADLDRGAAYTTVLAANARGREWLSSLRGKQLPILTKPSDTAELSLSFPERKQEIERQAELSARADALYSLCLPKVAEAGKYLRMSAVML